MFSSVQQKEYKLRKPILTDSFFQSQMSISREWLKTPVIAMAELEASGLAIGARQAIDWCFVEDLEGQQIWSSPEAFVLLVPETSREKGRVVKFVRNECPRCGSGVYDQVAAERVLSVGVSGNPTYLVHFPCIRGCGLVVSLYDYRRGGFGDPNSLATKSLEHLCSDGELNLIRRTTIASLKSALFSPDLRWVVSWTYISSYPDIYADVSRFRFDLETLVVQKEANAQFDGCDSFPVSFIFDNEACLRVITFSAERRRVRCWPLGSYPICFDDESQGDTLLSRLDALLLLFTRLRKRDELRLWLDQTLSVLSRVHPSYQITQLATSWLVLWLAFPSMSPIEYASDGTLSTCTTFTLTFSAPRGSFGDPTLAHRSVFVDGQLHLWTLRLETPELSLRNNCLWKLARGQESSSELNETLSGLDLEELHRDYAKSFIRARECQCLVRGLQATRLYL
jgi:hypothetical protein